MSRKWMQQFFRIMMLSLFVLALASGCTQNNETKLIQQVQDYLPATIQLKDAIYDSKETEDIVSLSQHTWQVSLDDETVTDNWVTVITDFSGTIVEFENALPMLGKTEEKNMNADAAQQLAVNCFADWSQEKNLTLQPWGSNGAAFYTPELTPGELGWAAASNEDDYYYDIIVNTQYGYVKHFQKYYANPNLRQQVLDWLEAEEKKLYEPYYHILGFTADTVQEYYQDENYILTLHHAVHYKSESNPADTASMQWAKDNLPETYPTLYAEYNQEQQSSLTLKIVVPVQEDGSLDMTLYTIYAADIDTEGQSMWTQIPDLSVLLKNERADLPGGWSAQ